MKKLGIALGAGGSRGVAHVGFLQALEEEGIKPDYITGSSMGAIVGAAYATGMPIEEIKEIVLNLRVRKLIAPTLKRGGFLSFRKARKILQKYLGDISFEDLKIPFRCVAVEINCGHVVELSKGKLLDGVIASATIPGAFHPIEKDGMRLVDGGVLERVPACRVREMGADVVVAVDVLGWRRMPPKKTGVVKVLLGTFDIMDNYRTQTYREENRDKIDFWLEPELGNMSQYSMKQIAFAYEQGYKLGKENAAAIKKALKSKK